MRNDVLSRRTHVLVLSCGIHTRRGSHRSLQLYLAPTEFQMVAPVVPGPTRRAHHVVHLANDHRQYYVLQFLWCSP